MRTWFDKLTIGFVIVFSVPTAAVILTWNSLPGNFDYPIKLAMEKALLLVVSPSYAAVTNLHTRYTERRFDEATRLVYEKQNAIGYVLLANEVSTTKSTILAGQNEKEQEQAAGKYVKSLEKLSGQLSAQKSSYIANAGARGTPPSQESIVGPSRRITSTPTSATPAQIVQPQQGTAPPISSPQQVIDTIDQTQQVIEETIEELEELEDDEGEDGQGRGKGHGQNSGNQGQGNQGQGQGQGNQGQGNQGQGQGQGQGN